MRNCVSVLSLLLAGATAIRPPVAPLPAWFEDVPIDVPAKGTRPLDRLLVDREIRFPSRQEVVRIVKRFNTPDAVESGGQIQIEYDPEWQSVKLHRARIRRETGASTRSAPRTSAS